MYGQAMQTARSLSAGQSVLSMAATVAIGAASVFWVHFYWILVGPTSLPEQLIAVIMGLSYAVVLPALCSMLVPTTPAGMLLQRTQHRTWGFVLIVAASLFLTFHAARLFSMWWSARPNAAGEVAWLTIGTIIITIGLPALAWVQTTPERWLAQVQQAHMVRRLEIMQAADLALAKAAYVRALNIMTTGLANATVEERREVGATIRAIVMAQNDTLRQIAGTLRTVTGIEARIGDTTIAERCENVANVLESAEITIHEDDAGDTPNVLVSSQSVGERRGGEDDATLNAARATLGTAAWTVSELAQALAIEPSTAGKLATEWKATRHIEALKLRGRYRFVEV